MTKAEIQVRYPRLLRCLQWVALLSPGEAVNCIRDHQDGLAFSGEAVNHFGGPRAVLCAAVRDRVRHTVLRFPAFRRPGV